MERYVAGRYKVGRRLISSLVSHRSRVELLEPKPLVYERKTEDTGMTEDEERELAELMSDDE